jgi:flagellar biosynthesis protein FlhG
LIRIVINQTLKLGDGRVIVAQLQRVLDRFIGGATGFNVKLMHVGDIPNDIAVREAVQKRQLLFVTLPGAPAALAMSAMTTRLEEFLVR